MLMYSTDLISFNFWRDLDTFLTARIRNQKFYCVINEVPTVLMILIVILVIVKPF